MAIALAGPVGCSDDPPAPAASEPGALPDFEPAPGAMRRLLARQYVNSVEAVFGRPAALAALPPVDSEINGFQSIAASQLAMTDDLVGQYERSALSVAAAAMGDADNIAALMACDPSSEGDGACQERFVRNAGRLLFRRPLVDEEAADYLDVAKVAQQQFGDFYAGIQYSIAALLESPNFLYQVVVGEALDGRPNVRVLKSYEMAARLSFFLTDTAPSAALLDAAEAGELDSSEGVRAMAESLLAQPEARAALASFFEEYLVLRGLEKVAKDPALFPEYSKDLAASMKLETLKLLDDIVFVRDASIREMFTADYTFIDENLANHYGVTPPEAGHWTRAALPAEQKRGGILTHASILTRQAHTNSTSATYRGLFVLERFFCQTMPPPPPDVDPTLPESSEAPTLRDRIKVHQEDTVCRTCHYKVDNIGLALENYDAVGLYRERENGALIDTHTELEDIGTFDGALELGRLLAKRDDVMSCLLRNVFRHATGHVESDEELKGLEVLDQRFAETGYRLREMLVELVASDAFRTVGVSE